MDGKRIASAGGHDGVTVWDVETGEELLALSEHPSDVNWVAYTSDGKRDRFGSRHTQDVGRDERQATRVSQHAG